MNLEQRDYYEFQQTNNWNNFISKKSSESLNSLHDNNKSMNLNV